MSKQVTDVLRQSLSALEDIDVQVSKALSSVNPEDLRDGFKTVLVECLDRSLADTTGLARRQVKIQLIYLIERFSEKLQDLAETGKITNPAEYMDWIDRAHSYAIAIVKEDDSAKFIEDFDCQVRPVSILDPKSPEERSRRRDAVKASYEEFLKARGAK